MDQFNHLHYLDLKYLTEEPKEKSNINLAELIHFRKNIFKEFKFIVLGHKEVVYNDFSIKLGKHNKGILLNFKSSDKIYIMKIHSFNEETEDKFYISNSSTIIHEDLVLQRANNISTYVLENSKEFYHFEFIPTEQFFYNKLNFNIMDSLKSYFFTFNNKQKQKQQITYYLHDSSRLEHHSFSDIEEKQLQDDSIEVIHDKNSSSILNYESLNKGKISSQLNSVISEKSNNCSTIQNINHFVLNRDAITNSKPNLIIKNPDVIANHGNSIGSFNLEDLFYLQQKGLTKNDSERILAKSKLENLLEKTIIKEELLELWRKK